MDDKPKVPQWALILLLFGGGTTAGVTVSDVFRVSLKDDDIKKIATAARPDPFTGAQARAMQERLDAEIKKRATYEQVVTLVCNELRLLRVEMPPGPTKDRIQAVERVIAEQHKQHPPTQNWASLPPACKSGPPW